MSNFYSHYGDCSYFREEDEDGDIEEQTRTENDEDADDDTGTAESDTSSDGTGTDISHTEPAQSTSGRRDGKDNGSGADR